MKIVSVADAKARLSAYVKTSEEGPVVITRHGKAVAAIIPIERDEDLERLALGYSPRLRAILAQARRRIREGQGLSHEQFWAENRSRGRRSRKI